MSNSPLEPLALTIKQFAELYQLNSATIATNITRAPYLLPKVTRFGRSIRFMKTDIEAWLQQSHHDKGH